MKRISLVLTGAFCINLLMAQSVSKELATHMALQYMRNDLCNVAPTNYRDLLTGFNSIDASLTSMFSPTGKAPLYIVQMQEGWVLVASEFVSTPILASAPNGSFPNDTEMPDGLRWLLSYYEDAMLYARDSLSIDRNEAQYKWEHLYDSTYWNNRNVSSLPSSYEIDNILSFLWDQNGNNSSAYTPYCDKVYEKFCPTWYTPTFCEHTYVGCTAVAMGIVMRYYKWPYSALIPNTIDSLGNISQEKHLVTYEWNKMPSSIYNSTVVANVNEIAGLLRDCGYAAKMKYRAHGSGANFSNAEYAMENNFHYSNMQYQTRGSNLGNWLNKLKTEIAADRPVIYAGYNNAGGGGHAFVLCGYTTDNKFKINWGWGNNDLNSGAYSLDSLTPPGHYYNDDQEAIIGIAPDYPDCTNTMTFLQQSDVNSDNFEIYQGGAISAQNITINNNRSGVVFSGEYITLGAGFKIEAGSQAVFDIKDMHCDDDRGDSFLSPENTPNDRHLLRQLNSLYKGPSALRVLRSGQLFIEKNGKIYNVLGIEVK